MQEAKIDISAMINDAISDSEVPKIYANGFATGIGNGDTLIVLQQNTIPIAVLNLSFTVAKTLTLKLGNLIKEIEDKADTVILTTDNFSKALSEKGTDEGKNETN